MKRWTRRIWGNATDLAGTRQGAALLVAAALIVHVIQSLGWPTGPGRDLESYLGVYVDFWHTDAVFPWEMLSRTPVAPLVVGGLLDLGSPLVVELVAALLFAGSILLYARTALLFGRGPAVLVGAALVLYPGYGIVFHELASEIVFSAGFAVWTAVDRPRRAPSLDLAVRRRGRRHRAHRAHPACEPGIPRRRDPAARSWRAPGARGSVARPPSPAWLSS